MTIISKKVAAAVIEKNNKFLIAQRAKKDSIEGKWEFPGGKQEPGETLQECLKRELFEEFEIVAQIGEYLSSSFFELNGNSYELVAFKVTEFYGQIKLIEHKEVKWVERHELNSYDFPDPDLPIIQKLISKLTK